MESVISTACVAGPMVIPPLLFLLVTVPAVGAWQSGWPSRRGLTRWSAAVLGLATAGSAVVVGVFAWFLWTGDIGPWFPFSLTVPDGTEGTVGVEVCSNGDHPRSSVVEVDDQGIGAVDTARWNDFYGKRKIRVHERSGRALEGGIYNYEVGPQGCALVTVAVHPTEPFTVPYPVRGGWEAMEIARREGVTFSEAATRPGP